MLVRNRAPVKHLPRAEILGRALHVRRPSYPSPDLPSLSATSTVWCAGLDVANDDIN